MLSATLPKGRRRTGSGVSSSRRPPLLLHAGGAQAGAARGQGIQPGFVVRRGGRSGRRSVIPSGGRQAVQQGGDLFL